MKIYGVGEVTFRPGSTPEQKKKRAEFDAFLSNWEKEEEKKMQAHVKEYRDVVTILSSGERFVHTRKEI